MVQEERRRFEFLVVELSVAVGRLVPRYALWLRLQEVGRTPGALTEDALISFCDRHLDSFLSEHGLRLSGREGRRLRRRIAHYDPSQPTPSEILERITAPPA